MAAYFSLNKKELNKFNMILTTRVDLCSMTKVSPCHTRNHRDLLGLFHLKTVVASLDQTRPRQHYQDQVVILNSILVAKRQLFTYLLCTSQEFDRETFLTELRKFPSIWCKKHPDYKQRNVKVNVWNKLAATFNKDGTFLFNCLTLFNRDLNRGCLVSMFSLRFSGSKFFINSRRQFSIRKTFSCT